MNQPTKISTILGLTLRLMSMVPPIPAALASGAYNVANTYYQPHQAVIHTSPTTAWFKDAGEPLYKIRKVSVTWVDR